MALCECHELVIHRARKADRNTCGLPLRSAILLRTPHWIAGQRLEAALASQVVRTCYRETVLQTRHQLTDDIALVRS